MNKTWVFLILTILSLYFAFGPIKKYLDKENSDDSWELEYVVKDQISLTNKGYDLQNKNHHEEAINYFNQAIEIDPGYADAWKGKGESLESIKRYDDALSAFNMVIKLTPNDERAWYFRCRALYFFETL